MRFYKKVHLKTQQKEGCFVISKYCKHCHLFDKSCTQENVKCHMNKVNLDES